MLTETGAKTESSGRALHDGAWGAAGGIAWETTSSAKGIEDASKALADRAKALKKAAGKSLRTRNTKITAVAMS